MNFIKLVFIGLAMTVLSACTKNVKWEEEVLLNTGETIWVTKQVRYTIKGQLGNPADLGYQPDRAETTSFKYGGRSFVYNGTAGVFVLAISPQKFPVLLASPGGKGWYRDNNYPPCAKPYYVQFVPDSTGSAWTWSTEIEIWTHNLPANLLVDRDSPSDVKGRYTMADKAAQPYMLDPRLLSSQKINPLFVNQDCPKPESVSNPQEFA
jgi:hypothetical protein